MFAGGVVVIGGGAAAAGKGGSRGREGKVSFFHSFCCSDFLFLLRMVLVPVLVFSGSGFDSGFGTGLSCFLAKFFVFVSLLFSSPTGRPTHPPTHPVFFPFPPQKFYAFVFVLTSGFWT